MLELIFESVKYGLLEYQVFDIAYVYIYIVFQLLKVNHYNDKVFFFTLSLTTVKLFFELQIDFFYFEYT